MLKFKTFVTGIILALQFASCNNTHNQTLIKQGETKLPGNIFGLYSYFVTDYNCESVKHSLRLNADSTFIFKIYCYADSTSPFASTVKTGKLTQQKDSIFNFLCTDKTSFEVKILNDSTIQIIPGKSEENYPFRKDTTTDEKFWRRQSK